MERGDLSDEHLMSRMRAIPDEESDSEEGAQENIKKRLTSEKLDTLFTEPASIETEKQAGLRPGEVTQYAFRELVIHMFGDTPDTMRMMHKWGERGIKGSDAWIKGLVTVDRNGEKRWTKTGPEVARWQDDEAAQKSAEFNSKTNGREHVKSQRRQNFFIERADPNGNKNFRELSAVGKWNLKVNVDRLLQVKAEHYQGELTQTFAENLDLLVEWSAQAKETLKQVQEGKIPSTEIELNQPEISRLDAFIGKISAMVLGLDEQKGVNMQALTDRIMEEENISEEVATEKARQQFNELVKNAITQSQSPAFWELQKEIQENRIEAGWDDESDWDELDADVINNAKKSSTGSTQYENPRLVPLQTEAKASEQPGQKNEKQPEATIHINTRGSLVDLEQNLELLTKQMSDAERSESNSDERQRLQQAVTELQYVIEIRQWSEQVEHLTALPSAEEIRESLKPESVKQLAAINQELSTLSSAVIDKNYKDATLIGDRMNEQCGSLERLLHELPEKLREQLNLTHGKLQHLRFHDTASPQANEIQLLHTESLRKVISLLVDKSS